VALLRRRSLWLIVFGFAHAALLMAGDILGSYGLASLWLGWLFLRRAERTLLVWGAIAAGLVALTMAPAVTAVVSGDLGLLGQAPTEPTTLVYAAGQENPVAAAGTRLVPGCF
jgi:uncharacterized protein